MQIYSLNIYFMFPHTCTLKTDSCHDANFVFTDGTVSLKIIQLKNKYVVKNN